MREVSQSFSFFRIFSRGNLAQVIFAHPIAITKVLQVYAHHRKAVFRFLTNCPVLQLVFGSVRIEVVTFNAILEIQNADTFSTMPIDFGITNCLYCKGMFEERLVNDVQPYQGRWYLLENVPALVCRQGGETYYTPQVHNMMLDQLQNEQPQRIEPLNVLDISKAS